MKWFGAHCLMLVEFLDGNQDSFFLWENILLISADTPEEAAGKASDLSRQQEGRQTNFTREGRPAKVVFAGLRKVVSCDVPDDGRLDGMEVSYNELIVSNRSDLVKLCRGEEVCVLHVD